MSVPCVVLASGPKAGAKWDEFEKRLAQFDPGPAPVDNAYRIFFKLAGTEDGGNGGGGEPGGKEMYPVLGVRRRGAWDFQQYAQSGSWDARFPAAMRFEVCLDFPDISNASSFLRDDTLGKQISNNFTTVMIVAKSSRKAT